LLENVALRIVKRMKNTIANIEQLSVKITKLNPPMNGNVKGVSIIVEE
jgi:dihydroneopterin aldolase